MKSLAIASCLAAGLLTPVRAQQRPEPVIDMHLHAVAAVSQGPPPLAMCSPMPALYRDASQRWSDVFLSMMKNPPCADPIWSPQSDEELERRTLQILDRRNIIGVASGPADLVRRWKADAPDRIIPALIVDGTLGISPDSIRRLHAAGGLAVLGEITTQYAGISPSDEALEPWLALAEELDLPVAIHVGTGPPGAPYLRFPNYRARLHSPLLLEDALIRHPRLRVYIMHAGWPMLDDLLAVLWTHPQVCIDVGIIDYALPEAEFYRYLRSIVEAGFGDRVLFGSDQMVWPEAIERAIERIEKAPFLSATQKRAILYDNAARFLRLSPDEVARHHGR